MRPGARIRAAIEVVEAIEKHHLPANQALSDWGRSHRFAGSTDRAVIGNLVFDMLRNRAAIAWKMGSDSPRALVLGALSLVWNRSLEEIAKLCDGKKYAPAPLTEEEEEGLAYQLSDADPLWVRANVPEWLMGAFERAFGERLLSEAQAMAERAPIDLRVNTLLSHREKILQAFEHYYAAATPHSPVGVRIPYPSPLQKPPLLEASNEHGQGYFELQDEGSQLAALMADAKPGLQVMDFCAGTGGKTLALAAAMENQGQIYAYDTDPYRLRRIFDRLRRAEVKNVQVLRPGDEVALHGLQERMDIVLVDAPCSGTGTWRRRPDTKWRLSPQNLTARIAEQAAILDQAAHLVRPGGRLVYVTCSVLPQENEDQVIAFIQRHPDFKVMPYARYWWAATRGEPVASAIASEDFLQLTPFTHKTDGFFIAIMVREKPQTAPQMPGAFTWEGE